MKKLGLICFVIYVFTTIICNLFFDKDFDRIILSKINWFVLLPALLLMIIFNFLNCLIEYNKVNKINKNILFSISQILFPFILFIIVNKIRSV